MYIQRSEPAAANAATPQLGRCREAMRLQSKKLRSWRPGVRRQSSPVQLAQRCAGGLTLLALAVWWTGAHDNFAGALGGLTPSLRPQASSASGQPLTALAAVGNYKVGDDIEAEVLKVSDHGVTVQIEDGITGFVHVSEMSVGGYVYHPSEEVLPGDKVQVRVRDMDEGFLQLTMKTVGRTRLKDLKVGQEVTGSVKKVLDFGAICDIGADVDAMIHKSEVKDNEYVANARDVFKDGDKIKALITSVDVAKKRVCLSMKSKKKVLEPLQKIKLADLETGQELGGTITSVRNFGFFVNVGAERDGLVHIRNVNNGIVHDIDEVAKHGDAVQVKVLQNVKGKLELALTSPLERLAAVDKFLPKDGDDEDFHEQWLEGTVSGLTAFGAFVEASPPGGGAPVQALLRRRAMTAGQSVIPGEKVQFRILEVDVEKKQLIITTKEARRQRTAGAEYNKENRNEDPDKVDTIAVFGEGRFSTADLESFFSDLPGFVFWRSEAKMLGGFVKFKSNQFAQEARKTAEARGLKTKMAFSSMAAP
eukprot:TRINITY_DN110956_c0_g1_i1.p1 TRINITY_DN110956_c0_g1~~TRINITY_DN110956_c0_g1_i1.p1  ORF type:complete len:534 (+),score=157.47 TRINITY_DN110956_c0_g1_i1:144-1745(+)